MVGTAACAAPRPRLRVRALQEPRGLSRDRLRGRGASRHRRHPHRSRTGRRRRRRGRQPGRHPQPGRRRHRAVDELDDDGVGLVRRDARDEPRLGRLSDPPLRAAPGAHRRRRSSIDPACRSSASARSRRGRPPRRSRTRSPTRPACASATCRSTATACARRRRSRGSRAAAAPRRIDVGPYHRRRFPLVRIPRSNPPCFDVRRARRTNRVTSLTRNVGRVVPCPDGFERRRRARRGRTTTVRRRRSAGAAPRPAPRLAQPLPLRGGSPFTTRRPT